MRLNLTKYVYGFENAWINMSSEYELVYINMSHCQDSEYAWICIIDPNVPRYAGVLNMVESA